mgnify:CR=1 FL=1
MIFAMGKPQKELIAFYPDFGGCFAFVEEDGYRLSMCCGSDDYYWNTDPDASKRQSFRDEYGISAELMHDIIVWVRFYNDNIPPDEGSRRNELQPIYERIDAEAKTLAERFKAEVGDSCRVAYGVWAYKNGGPWHVIEL